MLDRLRLAFGVFGVVALLSTAACAPDSDPTDDESEEDTADDEAATSSKPIGCADPGVMREGDHWFVTCTGGGNGGIYPIYRSNDLKEWTPAGSVLSNNDKGWGKGKWWAPEIHHVPGGYATYYSALDSKGRLSIGAAFASTPTGPFNPDDQPLVQKSFSVIDAHVYSEGNKHWLYYKRDDNWKDTTIFVQELDASGHKLKGSPKAVLNFSQGWEGKLIEAPWIVHHGSSYYLFYSGGIYCNQTYAVGVARASSPTGPFTKHSGPILSSGSQWVGPGHNSVTTDGENVDWIVYHAYDKKEHAVSCENSANNPPRRIQRKALSWSNGWPVVKPPKRACQLRCCDGTIQKVGDETRTDCRNAFDACSKHGWSKRIRWGENVIFEKTDPKCTG